MNESANEKSKRRRERLFEIIQVGMDYDFLSRGYDFLNAATIIINVTASILYTFDPLRARYGRALVSVELITAAFFAIDYILRIYTADCLYPGLPRSKAIWRYLTSISGLIDLFSFLPYFLPFFFPTGMVAFRLVRIIRILRLFRINAYYDSLKVIWDVVYGKRQQLIASVTIILILMVGSSLCMYSLEHDAQPDVFKNALSGIWWSASTLLTVGYGDIYPITTAGKIFGIIITFLGVGMVAIPTGIISAGFVDQYSRVKKMTEYGREADLEFLKITLTDKDIWVNERIGDLTLPEHMMIAMVKRGKTAVIPRGDIVLQAGDVLVIGAETPDNSEAIELREVELQKNNPWVNTRIRDLDISRQTVIVMVRRGNHIIIPRGDLILREKDTVVLYTQRHIPDATNIEV